MLPEALPLACPEVLTPRQLEGVPFVSLYREHMTHAQLAEALRAAGCHWNVVAEAQYFAICCAFAATGEVVSISHPVTAHFYRGRGSQFLLGHGLNAPR